ncbi:MULTISPECIES: TetR/AcrR family transcriptional regulator [Halobacterium]|uniref:TetR/AcrR family transcriptional regulator n=1 Tax=Halobacterium TaxID=2239 RepID=UPI0009EAE8CE|nr:MULTISPECIES: TetR/AcrR family transcriptional regulator [Halobacterium]MCG1004954.1 TetR/AcrR family transcriptional regulator [Halobacterium noricense]
MPTNSPFEGPPNDTREEILRAAFLVVQKHGYDGLSMNRIADEVGIQKSSVYHHYSDKDTLLLSLVDYVMAELEYRIMQPDDATPLQKLKLFIDQVIFGRSVSSKGAVSPPAEPTLQVFLQIRAQATYAEPYQEKVTEIERLQQAHIVDIIQRGIASGDFRDIATEPIAALLVTLATGVLSRRVTTTVDLNPVHEAIHEYLRVILIK